MKLVIDVREKSLIAECFKLLDKLEIKNLPLGDAIIQDDSGNDLIIIERKTLTDLASSIKDGRYEEQGFRLNQCGVPNHNIFYLVEGNLQRYDPIKSRLDKKTLLSSFVSLTYSKKFSLHRTDSLLESAEWIIAYMDKLGRIDKSPPTEYLEICKKKQSNITTDNILPIMLSQIPSVSPAIAKVIMDKYKTFETLINEIKTTPENLYKLTTVTKSGKSRKISKTSIDNICKYLL